MDSRRSRPCPGFVCCPKDYVIIRAGGTVAVGLQCLTEESMSHHLDSPIARQDIRLDITDLYVFRGETGTVFVIDLCHSIFGTIPVPGYHPEGMYEFKVDLDADAVEDLTYRITFDDRDAQGKQRYVVRCIKGADAVKPDAPGVIVARGTTGETVTTPTGLPVWADKAGDPFWIEPDVLHAVGHAFQDGTRVNLSGWDRSPSTDFATYGATVAKSIAGVVAANGTAQDPCAYGEKFAQRIFPNMLPYEVGTPAVFGLAEWNGRSLTDNAPDVMFSIAANAPVSLGIGKESVTSKPSTTFPYVPPAS